MQKFAWIFVVSAAMCGTTCAANPAADPTAGKAKTEESCSTCHEKADWAGTDAETLKKKIKGVVSGKTKHKKTLKLTDAEMSDIAAYWSSP